MATNLIGKGRIIDTNIRSKSIGRVRLKFQNTLKSFSKERDSPVDRTGRGYAIDVKKEAQRIIRTEAYWKGNLHNSIAIKEISKPKRTEFLVLVEENLLGDPRGYNYANVIEHGGRPHRVYVVDKPALQQWIVDHLGEEALERILLRGGDFRVQHPGIHFMERAFGKIFRVKPARLKKAVEMSLKESGFKTD